MRVKFLLAAATAATCVTTLAHGGDWITTILEIDEGQGFPTVNAAWDNRQAGSIDPGLQQPTIWLGAPGTAFQAVLPPSSDGAKITALTPITAVGDGYAPDFGGYVVMVWNATGTSVQVIQAPPGFNAAFANGASDTQQVGVVEDNNIGRNEPALWTGTTASFVNLLPSGFEGGSASATNGVQQVGGVTSPPDYFYSAALWTGSANSFVNLHPGGVWLESEALGVSNGVQVGVVYDEDGGYAAAWTGTPGSMVLLHPAHVPNINRSRANAINNNNVICGSIRVSTDDGNQRRAALWTALDPMSHVDLHNLLGPG